MFCIDEWGLVFYKKNVCPMKLYISPCNLTITGIANSDYPIISVCSPKEILREVLGEIEWFRGFSALSVALMGKCILFIIPAT